MSSKNSNDAADTIDALSVAVEYLMCAIRSLGHGISVDDSEVREPLLWAASKMREAGVPAP